MTVKDTVKDTADRASTAANDTLAAAGDKLHVATDQLRDAASTARASAGEAIDTARVKVADAYEGARSYAAETAEAARERANAAYASARETASTVRGRASSGIEDSPIAAVIGGIAVGVLLGTLLPRSQKEAETLAPIGDKLAALARTALAAAKDAGQDTLDELGINKDAAREQANRLIDGVSKAATSAGSAAADAIREPRA